MMKFKEYLDEGLSPILYHYTTADILLKMLKQDRFFLSATISTGADEDLGNQKVWFLSTARNKTGGYGYDKFYEKSYHVMIEIDGRKISQNYSGRPVDYWGSDFRKMDPVKYNEMEDRVFADEDHIPNLKKYIKSVHIYIPKEDKRTNNTNWNDISLRNIRRSIIILKKKGIPYQFYDTKDTFFSQRKPIPFNSGLLRVHGKEEYFNHPSGSSYSRDAHSILRLLLATNFDHITRSEDNEAFKIAYKIRYESGAYIDSMIHQLFKNVQTDEKGRKYLGEISKIMKKNRIKGTKELADFLKNKVIAMTEK